MNEVVIYATCRVIEVRLTVGASSSMSQLEQHVLTAVHAGVDTVPRLCGLLGITTRMMVDLLGDMWRAGCVDIDLRAERVALTDKVRDAIRDGSLAQLAGAEVVDDESKVMLDTLSGMVLPVSGLLRAPRSALIVPEHAAEAQVVDIGTAPLMEALTRSLNSGATGGSGAQFRARRVLKAYLKPDSLRGTGKETRWRAVGIRVALDTRGRLVVHLADDTMPLQQRAAAQARLSALADSMPASPFVRALRQAAAGRTPEEPRSLETMLGDAEQAARQLSTVEASQRKERHRDLVSQSHGIVRRLHSIAEHEAGLRILTGQTPHADAIRTLIRTSRRQLVMACPWIVSSAFHHYAEEMERAVGRGVQIVLLWGNGRDEVLDQATRNALAALQRSAGTTGLRVLLSPRTSSAIHARLVVRDNREALVTSLNFLDPPRTETHEVGVLVDSVGAVPHPAVAQMLLWARATMPDYTVAQSILTDSASFPDTSTPAGSPTPVPALNDDPPLTKVTLADHGPAAAVWAAAWEQRIAQLTDFAARHRDSVQMLRDAEHREALQTALSTARRRLLIASDGLAEGLVDQAFIDQIEERLSNRVDVTVVYRHARQDKDREAAVRLAGLAARAKDDWGRLTVAQRDNHAKVLVAGDESIVTSFNFLSFEGYYRGAGRRRQRSEVGLRIHSRSVADRLLAEFGVEPAPVAEPVEHVDGPSAAALHGLTAAQHILESLTDLTGTELADLAGTGGFAVATLAALRDSGTAPEALERVVAAVLSRTAATGTDVEEAEQIDGWWAWLSRRRFEDGDFQVAAVLRAAAKSAEPRRALATVAARRGDEGVGAALVEASLESDLRPDEYAALLTVAVFELLRAGDGDAADGLEICVAAVDPLWRPLGDLALKWWNSTRRPLPVERIRREDERDEISAVRSRLWTALDECLAAFERYSPPFMSGSTTRKFLLRPGGSINMLTTAVTGRDITAVRAWLDEPKLKDIGAWVDAATQAAGMKDLIHGHLRPPFVERVEAIVSAARDVVEHDGVSGGGHVEAYDETVGLARDCLGDLRKALASLTPVVGTVSLPERALVVAALDDLDGFSRVGAR